MHKNEILKEKSSEELALKKLPMHSTNMSDAFKYLMRRKKWVKITNGRKRGRMTAPSMVGDRNFSGAFVSDMETIPYF